jgi:hypothetical protein
MKMNWDDIVFGGLITFTNRPKGIVSEFNDSETTPSVAGVTLGICSGAVVTITDFLGGTDGESVKLLGDGTTTITNGTNIFTNTGANKLLAASKVYTFTYVDSLKQWFENA